MTSESLGEWRLFPNSHMNESFKKYFSALSPDNPQQNIIKAVAERENEAVRRNKVRFCFKSKQKKIIIKKIRNITQL